jgi:hypothetical protein
MENNTMKRLTKSQYEMLASVLRWQKFGTADEAKVNTVNNIALELAFKFLDSDNQFDRQKFLELCDHPEAK